jgi:hypothetical protein
VSAQEKETRTGGHIFEQISQATRQHVVASLVTRCLAGENLLFDVCYRLCMELLLSRENDRLVRLRGEEARQGRVCVEIDRVAFEIKGIMCKLFLSQLELRDLLLVVLIDLPVEYKCVDQIPGEDREDNGYEIEPDQTRAATLLLRCI